MLVDVEPVSQVLLLVPPADGHVAGVEHLSQLVAHEIDHRLEVELRRHPLLDAVDDRKLGGALLLGPEETLRFVEEACVFQRDAHGVGERLQQAHIRIREGALALLADTDHATRSVAAQDGDIDKRVVGRASTELS
jgi:hypothetical protein